MRRTLHLLLATGLLATAGARAASPPSAAEILAGAPAGAWRDIPAAELLVMTLAGGRRVVIQLAPDWAPVHVANLRRLAQAGWWTGGSITRVQDDYVVQWAGRDPARRLPPLVAAQPPAEYDRPAAGIAIHPLGFADAYAPQTGFADGWPVASGSGRAWLVHCYGMVGVGRDLPPDTGSGVELYTVIGQAPRHLDRNIALVGRVIDGMPALAALPRGTDAMGVYATPAERVPIAGIALAGDLPPTARPHAQAMRTDSPAFAAWLAARANRREDFFVRPAGAVDLCNAPVPTRLLPQPGAR